jgi:hypothetical protein
MIPIMARALVLEANATVKTPRTQRTIPSLANLGADGERSGLGGYDYRASRDNAP